MPEADEVADLKKHVKGNNHPPLFGKFLDRTALLLALPIALTYVFLAWSVSTFVLISPIWPSTGIAVAAVMLFGRSAIVGVFVGSFFANYLLFNWSPSGALIVSFGNVLAPFLGIMLYRKSTAEDYFADLKSIGLYLFYFAVVGSIVSAFFGALSNAIHYHSGFSHVLNNFVRWWVGDLTSTMILTPVFYLWGQWFLLKKRKPSGQYSKPVLLFIWILVLSGALLIFGYHGTYPSSGGVLHIGLMSLVLPPLIWVSLQYNPLISMTLFSNVYALAAGCTMLGRGPFTHFPLEESMTSIQIMSASIGTAILIISVLNLQRRQVTDSLHHLNKTLSDRVLERSKELVQSESRLRHILELSPMPILVSELETSRILFVNDECLNLFEVDRERAKSITLMRLWVDPQERDHVINRLYDGEQIRNHEVPFHHPNGGVIWLSLSVVLTKLDNKDALMFALKDISRHKNREAELLSRATTDSLTGLYNRHQVRTSMQRFISDPRTRNSTISICMFDLDHFKKVNDKYGHDCGDKVLISIATRARNGLRGEDVLARWGGEEFLLIMPHTTEPQAITILERMRQQIQETIIECDDGVQITCTASFGLVSRKMTSASANMIQFDEWIKQADLALYCAKNKGRNRIETD